MEEVSRPPDWCQSFIYADSLAGDILGVMPSNSMSPGAQAEHTAYDFRCAAQDQIDSMLWRCAAGYDASQIEFSTELVSLAQDGEGVTVTVSKPDGSQEDVRAQYLVAADGGKSAVREALKIHATGPTALGTFVNCHFTADLSRWAADREAALIWTLGERRGGVFHPLDGRRRWMAQIMFDPGIDPPDSWQAEKVLARLRAMIGDPEAEGLDIELHSAYPYAIDATVADQLRAGRVFLVGDAAHRIPPAGGFGMNTGVQTAHNLAWKLALVMNGLARDRLLDTFESERREVAQRACDYGVANLGHVRAIRMAPTQEARIAAVAASRQYGNWAGLDLGVHYEGHGAYVADDTSVPVVDNAVADYIPVAKPGWRAPHFWLKNGHSRQSVHDLVEKDFVLLTGREGAGWVRAAGEMTPTVRAYQVHPEGELVPEVDFCSLYGIEESGAAFLRPDGHVAWRIKSRPADPGAALRTAIDLVLSPAQEP